MPKRDLASEWINAAIDKLERYGMEITPASVWANIDVKAMSFADAEAVLAQHIKSRINPTFKARGLIIINGGSGERKSFWDATPDELEEQIAVKRRSSDFDANRLAADSAVLIFLREKEKDYGYTVYPELFKSDITRIYAMHGITPARVAA